MSAILGSTVKDAVVTASWYWLAESRLLHRCALSDIATGHWDSGTLGQNTSTQTFPPFVDSSVNNVLLQTNPDFNRLLFEFIHILERRLIDPLLHDPQSLIVIDQIEVRLLGTTDPEK